MSDSQLVLVHDFANPEHIGFALVVEGEGVRLRFVCDEQLLEETQTLGYACYSPDMKFTLVEGEAGEHIFLSEEQKQAYSDLHNTYLTHVPIAHCDLYPLRDHLLALLNANPSFSLGV